MMTLTIYKNVKEYNAYQNGGRTDWIVRTSVTAYRYVKKGDYKSFKYNDGMETHTFDQTEFECVVIHKEEIVLILNLRYD